jgi:hypothetical protein
MAKMRSDWPLKSWPSSFGVAVHSNWRARSQAWAALHPAEKTRIVQLLVERVTVGEDGIAVDLRHDGLGSVVRDMMAPRQTEACA